MYLPREDGYLGPPDQIASANRPKLAQLESVVKIVRGVFRERTREPGHRRDPGQRLSDRIDSDYPRSNALLST
jgi:hypothetical protein